MIFEAFEVLRHVGEGMNSGAADEAALREACGVVSRLGQESAGDIVRFLGVCPTFYTLCTSLILGPLSTNSAMSKERYLIA
jgi:hypothetical protein